MSSPQDSPAATGVQVTRAGSGGKVSVLAAMGGAVAAVVAALVVGLSSAQALSLLGIPDPGPLTTYGLPALRAVADLAAALTVGSLLFAAFFVPPQADGLLDVGGYRALRRAGNAALVWAGASALLVPLTLSDTTGQPFLDSLRPESVWRAANQVDVAGSWRSTVFFVLALAVGCRLALRWGWTPVLLLLSVISLLPVALTGHSSAGGAHDIATNSLILHLLSACFWVGGLFAVLAYALRDGKYTALATRRFSKITTISYVVIAISGVINAWIRVPWADLFTTTYGRLVLAKTTALIVLGIIGYLQRQRAIPALEKDPSDRGALIRFAGVESLIFAATIGLAVGLGRTPPPELRSVPTPAEVEIGYNLAGPPNLARLAFDWRFDLIFGTLAIVLAVLYLRGVARLKKRGDAWPVGRTISWIAACAVLLIATSSGVGRYAPAMFSVHMAQHMMLSMLAPILFALGGPVLLALRALPPAGRDAPPGPREWILAAVHNPVSRFMTQPVVAAVFFVAGFYVLYLGGLFDQFVGSHGAHLLMNVHFLLSGYLFYWVVIGIDPKPRQVEPLTKLGMVFGSLPFHAFFGIALMSMNTVLGGWFYRALGLGWNNNLLDDQHTGGSLAWASGEIPLVVVMLALLIQWSRSDKKLATRLDRAADRDDDAELASYNAMYAELARRDREVRK
ncbi:cytochrome c oxidase assembly protein [Nocardia sp. NPDC052001]|uniref:cytochrome c oxidase assembly protein n=1 Tax=Nocardia sp. NPDC052001 TaxID=3154853 RepID=UPI003418E620